MKPKLPDHLRQYFESAEHQAQVIESIKSLQAARDSADQRWLAKFGRPFITSVDDLADLLAANGETISAIVDPTSALSTAPLHEVIRLLEKKMAAEHEQRPIDDSKWPTITVVANGFSENKGTVSRWIKPGGLRDNGKAGSDRRIDPLSIVEYCETKKLAYSGDPDHS